MQPDELIGTKVSEIKEIVAIDPKLGVVELEADPNKTHILIYNLNEMSLNDAQTMALALYARGIVSVLVGANDPATVLRLYEVKNAHD